MIETDNHRHLYVNIEFSNSKRDSTKYWCYCGKNNWSSGTKPREYIADFYDILIAMAMISFKFYCLSDGYNVFVSSQKHIFVGYTMNLITQSPAAHRELLNNLLCDITKYVTFYLHTFGIYRRWLPVPTRRAICLICHIIFLGFF